VQNTPFSINKTLNIRGRLLSLDKPSIMGILNITPDSFYDGGNFNSESTILTQAAKMLSEGATFIDVGGYSSRPGAADVPVAEEIKRVVPAIKSIIKEFPEAIISIDTFRSEVARTACDHGASMVTDISGGQRDSLMFETVATLNVPYILMHMRGTPETMARDTNYQNLLRDIFDYLHVRLRELQQHGVKDIIIDPGFGFAKNREQNFELLNHLDMFHIFSKPILCGLSRKSMVWKTLNITPDDALNGTTSLNTIALLKGASVLRVHDVKQAREVVDLYLAMNKHNSVLSEVGR
jgi:dihydropteroate synthase